MSKESDFTPRQVQVIQYALLGISTKDIAERLGIKEGTLRNHLQEIYRILKVSSRDELFWKVCERYQWKNGKLVRRPILHRRYEMIKGGGKGNANIKQLVELVRNANRSDNNPDHGMNDYLLMTIT